MKIKIIAPVLRPDAPSEGVHTALRSDLPDSDQVDIEYLETGPASVEGDYDRVLAGPDTIRIAVDAENDGYALCVIDCMADPGLEAAREAVEIPVLGTAETTMHVAGMLGRRYSILTILDKVEPSFEELSRRYGIGETCVSVRSIDMPVKELEQKASRTIDNLVHEGVNAIEEDGADTILFGCTGMLGFASEIQSRLKKEGYRVPVIDPLPTTVHVARGLATVGLSHSPLGYRTPDDKVRTFDPVFSGD